MYSGTKTEPALAALAATQAGVVSRRQLCELGVSHHVVERHIEAERWTAWARTTVLHQNSQPTRDQLMWIALVDAGPSSALACHTSLEVAGFRGFAEEAASVHIVVPRGAKYAEIGGVVVHESRRHHARWVQTYGGYPCVEVATSAIDAASWQPWPRFAVTMMAAVVQQRACSVRRLDQTLAIVGRVRHKRHMRLALLDIEGGAESLGEIDVARLCRRFGLLPPTRQTLRRDPSGRISNLDCEWDVEGGVVVLEVDGSHHLLVAHWEADMKRERQIVISRSWVLRASAFEVRNEAASVADDLRAMGVPANTTELSDSRRHSQRGGF